MDQNLQNALRGLSQSGDQLHAAINQLTAMFPGVSHRLAWQETIFIEQHKYRSGTNDPHDYQLEIALRWLKLARVGRLKVEMGDFGFSVTEIDDTVLVNADLERVIFKEIQRLSGKKWLLYPDLYAAVDRFLGLSLSQHRGVFEAVLEALSDKRYVRYEVVRGTPRIIQGLDFDEWSDKMTKPQPPSVTNNMFTFHEQVSVVQTGAGSVANLEHAVGASPYSDLKSALQFALKEFAASDLPPSKRQEAEEYIATTVQEIDKEKPNLAILKVMFSGLASTIQTLGSTSDAFKAVTGALAFLGFS